MSTPANTEATHPERYRRYSVKELHELADAGNAWAIGKVDDWERTFSNEYGGPLADRCTDPHCESYGEPMDLCCDDAGVILDADHGGWGHRLPDAEAA